MRYIYIDESGDLGKKGSRYFVMTAVKINDEKTNKRLKRIPRKIRQINPGKKIKKTPELKFSNSSRRIREQYLFMASQMDIGIYSLIIEKKKSEYHIMTSYKKALIFLLEHTVKDKDTVVFIDKSMTKNQQVLLDKTIPRIKLVHEDSAENKALQVADFICGAFGHKYNKKNNHFSEIVKNKILLEKITTPAYLS